MMDLYYYYNTSATANHIYAVFTTEYFCRKALNVQGESPSLVVREMTRACEVVGLNPCTVYWMDMTLFTLICVNNSIVCLKRSKINKKDAGVGPFKKILNVSHKGPLQHGLIQLILDLSSEPCLHLNPTFKWH